MFFCYYGANIASGFIKSLQFIIFAHKILLCIVSTGFCIAIVYWYVEFEYGTVQKQ